jgi:uncharacterized membrane-anchored protein
LRDGVDAASDLWTTTLNPEQIAATARYSFEFEPLRDSKAETFYWVTIMFSQTLGTALGDWAADGRLGYLGGALVFGAALALVAAAYFWTAISHVTLFWAAFILTRPLDATVGDFFDKPVAEGGLNVSRPLASAVIAAVIIACILVFPQRAGEHPGDSKAT